MRNFFSCQFYFEQLVPRGLLPVGYLLRVDIPYNKLTSRNTALRPRCQLGLLLLGIILLSYKCQELGFFAWIKQRFDSYNEYSRNDISQLLRQVPRYWRQFFWLLRLINSLLLSCIGFLLWFTCWIAAWLILSMSTFIRFSPLVLRTLL